MLPSAQSGLFKPNARASGNVDGAAYFTPPTVVPGTLFACLFQNTNPACGPGPVNNPQPFGPLPSAPGIQRNSYRGPGYFDVDATLSKSFGLPPMKVLGENAKLEFRANFYNLFNKLNLWNPQPDILSNHLGEAQSALGSRVIEMQARFNF